jgi:hypothetical protein
MGFFDFVTNPGTTFTNEEIAVLDKNFCSISNYTKKKYDFQRKLIDDKVKTIPHIGVPCHEIKYQHINIEDSNDHLYIACLKYKIYNSDNLKLLTHFYEWREDNEKIKMPKIEIFPTKIIRVGWHGLGFINVLEYENGNQISNNCEQIIRNNSLKFLKNIEMDFKEPIVFE